MTKDRVPTEDKEELQNPDGIDVALIFAAPPRYYRRDRIYWRGHKSGILGINLGADLGLETLDVVIEDYISKEPIINDPSSAMTKKQRKITSVQSCRINSR